MLSQLPYSEFLWTFKINRGLWSVLFERKRDLFSKRLARILYLCFCTRIAMKITFEFGFKESNLMRRSFHGGAMTSTLWENAFLEGMTHKTKAKILKFVKIFICGFASFVKLVREDEIMYAWIQAPPWNDLLIRLLSRKPNSKRNSPILVQKQRERIPASLLNTDCN